MLVDFGSFHSRFDNVINDSFNYTVTSLLDTDETVRNLSIEFSVALLRLVVRLFMFLLIFGNSSFSTNVFPNFFFIAEGVALLKGDYCTLNLQNDEMLLLMCHVIESRLYYINLTFVHVCDNGQE